MTDTLDITLWTFVRLIVWALVLVLLLRGLRLALQFAPMAVGRRRSLEQAFPMVELLVAVAYLVSAVQIVFATQPQLAAVAVLGILFGGLWLARQALTDLVTGVFLRTSGSVAKGDHVRLDGLDGHVTWLGSRSLAIETREGEEALVPYSRLAGRSVLRTPRVDGAYRYTFRLSTEPGAPVASADRIRHVAMLCHWSSIARPPTVQVHEGGDAEVTVFALEADRGAEIEAFVRKALRT